MGWIGWVHCEKFWRHFVAQTFALVSARCAPSFVRQLNGPKCTQIVWNTPKRHFRVQWVDQVRFLRKIPTWLRGTNFCTSVDPLFTEFCKATKRSQMHPIYYETHQNVILESNGWIICVPCEKFRRDFVARTFALVSARFAPSFVRQPNSPECTQIVWNAPKHQFRF